MHFKQIKLHNFGLYKGVHVLDLSVKKDNKKYYSYRGYEWTGENNHIRSYFCCFLWK